MRGPARETIFDRARTPGELESYVQAVKKGTYDSLFIVGPGGIGKSSIVEKVFPKIGDGARTGGKGAHWREGKITPVQLYEFLYHNRDEPIVMDDAPNLENNLAIVGLLRQVTDTRKIRTIGWDTQNFAMEEKGIPKRFNTQSPFIMITNVWFSRHEEVAALETRCPIVHYLPTAETIHEIAKKNAKRFGYVPPVIKYIESAIKAGRVHCLNFRDYYNASRRFRAGHDWQRLLDHSFLPNQLETIESPEEFILSWAIRFDREDFTRRDILMGTRYFRKPGGGEELDTAITRLCQDKRLEMFLRKAPEGQAGRPPGPRYRLPKRKAGPVTPSRNGHAAKAQTGPKSTGNGAVPRRRRKASLV